MFVEPRAGGTLAGIDLQGLCALGTIRTGGNYTLTEPGVLELRPDRAPSTVLRLTDLPYPNHPNRRGEYVGDIVGYRGNTGRVAIEGTLMSDGRTVLFQGFGLMGPNEVYPEPTQEMADQFNAMQQTGAWVPAPAYGGIARWDKVSVGLWDVYTGLPLCLGAPAGSGGEDTSSGETAPAPDPDWTGEQGAVIAWDAGAKRLTVYGDDGNTYTGVEATSDPAAWEGITTVAPQGQRLVIDGEWSPGDGTVSVQDWFIEETGTKEYGIDPDTGGFSPDPEDRAVAEYTDPETGEPTTTGNGGGNGGGPGEEAAKAEAGWLALAVMGGLWFLAAREED